MSSARRSPVEEVAADVFFARGRDVNWVLLRDGRDVTLVDTGYPGYLDDVLASIAAIGCAPQHVAAILLTHAHVDHVGGVHHFVRQFGTPVYTDATEARHARREFLEQAAPLDVARNLRRPGMVPWLRRVVPAGVAKKVTVASAEAFPTELDLPGRPVPVPTRGHTSGHVAYHLPAARAVITGDELVTGHALLAHDGPAVLPAFFGHGDSRAALATVAALDADLVLPGHGAALRVPVAEAVEQALR